LNGVVPYLRRPYVGYANDQADSLPLLDLGASADVEPTPDPDLCRTAVVNGAIFCEPGVDRSLEYCVPAAAEVEPCAVYETPPVWVYDLLLQCVAHCGVHIDTSRICSSFTSSMGVVPPGLKPHSV